MVKKKPTKNKNPKRVSMKQIKFAQEFSKSGNGTRAALKAYDIKGKNKNNIANVIAIENLRKPTIQKLVKRFADHIPDSLLVKKHLELLNVPRKVRRFIKGELEIETEEVDSLAVGKGLDMAYKLKGLYAPEKKLVGNFNLGDLESLSNEELAKLLEAETTEDNA